MSIRADDGWRRLVAALLAVTPFCLVTPAALAQRPTQDDVRRLEGQINQQILAGDFDAAAATAAELVDVLRRAIQSDDGSLKGRVLMLAPVLCYGGRISEAVALTETFVERSGQQLGKDHWRAADARVLLELITKLAALSEEELLQAAEAERGLRRAQQLFRQGDLERAATALAQAVKTRQSVLGSENPLHAGDLAKLGLVRMQQRQLNEALRLSLSALEVIERVYSAKVCPTGHPFVAELASTAGGIAKQQGQHNVARKVFETALAQQRLLFPRAKYPDGHERVLGAINNLVDVLIELRAIDVVAPLVAESLATSKALFPHGSPRVGDAHLMAAKLACVRADFGAGHQHLIRAMEQYEDDIDGERPRDILHARCRALEMLVFVEKMQGNVENSEIFARLALGEWRQVFPETEHPLGSYEIARALGMLAVVEQSLGKFDVSIDHHQEAIAMLERLFERDRIPAVEARLARAIGNYASCLMKQNKLEAALPLFEQQLEVLKRVDGTSGLGSGRHQLVDAEIILGKAMMLMGRTGDEYLPHLDRGVELAREMYPRDRYPHGHPRLIEAIHDLAYGRGRADQDQGLMPLLIELVDLRHTYIADEMAQSHVDTLARGLYMLEMELDWLLTGAYVGRDEHPQLVELAYRWFAGQKSIVLDTLLRARRVERTLADDPEIAEMMRIARDTRARWQQFTLNPPDYLSPDKLEEERVELEFRVKASENQLMSALAARSGEIAIELPSAEALRAQLPSRDAEAVVDIVLMNPMLSARAGVGRPVYLAFVLRPGDEPLQLVYLGLVEEIDAAIAELRDHMQDAPRNLRFASEEALVEEYKELAAALYAQVMAPLEEALGGARKILIAPDGELNRIAFETLVDEAGRYLIEDYTFAYLSSSSDLLRERAEPGEGAVLFADPDFDLDRDARQIELAQLIGENGTGSVLSVRALPGELTRGITWQRLPGSEREAALVAELLVGGQFGEVTSYTSRQALEELLKQTQRPRLLHLATHGFYLPEPEVDEDLENDGFDGGDFAGLPADDGGLAAPVLMGRLKAEENPLFRSGLVLAGANIADTGQYSSNDDGWVTAEEVAMLDLQGTQLVVLSACETGLADVRAGENVSGLRRAFLQAGAESLITSLYKVLDQATQQLMERFYTNLRQQDPWMALRDAQRQQMLQRQETEGAAHPFFWGSFIFVGAP